MLADSSGEKAGLLLSSELATRHGASLSLPTGWLATQDHSEMGKMLLTSMLVQHFSRKAGILHIFKRAPRKWDNGLKGELKQNNSHLLKFKCKISW